MASQSRARSKRPPANLREVVPRLYLSVPKGYEELVPWLRRDRARRVTFVSRVRMHQYAGASIAKLATTSWVIVIFGEAVILER